MAREINRKRLTRMFSLPDGADDAEIIAQIRWHTERMNSCLRPFILPTGLDLRGCLYALQDCMRGDQAFGDEAYNQLFDEIESLKAACKERVDPIGNRTTLLWLIIEAARDQTEWEPPSVCKARRDEEARAKQEAAREKRRQKKAAKAAETAGRT